MTMAEALRKVYEDGHEDVSSSKRMCQTIIEDATQIRTKLDSMSAEDKLDTWWTNKLAKSADNLNSARDYIMNPIEESFEFSLDEGRMKTIYTMQQQGKTAKEIAKYMKLPVKTIKDILGEEDLEEKIRPFLLSYSKGGSHEGFEDADTLPELQKKAQELRRKGFTIDKMGRYNPPVGDMFMKKFARKEEVELVEFSDAMLDRLAREFAPLKGKSISVQQANKLRAIFNNIPDRALDALRRKKIPFLSGLALSRMVQKGMPVKEQVEDEKEKKEADNKDTVIATLKDQIAMLKQKLENEKNKAVKPEPNPDTGEVPLTIGLANKLLKDKEMKKEDVQEADLTKPQIKKVHKMADELPKKDFKDRYGKKKGDAVRYATATNIVKVVHTRVLLTQILYLNYKRKHKN